MTTKSTSSRRVKAPVLTPQSSAQAEIILGDYAAADAKIQQLTAAMDERITKIRDEYAEELQSQNDVRKEKFEALQLFAESNRQLFEKKRGLEMAHGVVGFRTGTPKLSTIKGFTWAAITNLLKSKLPAYVRMVEEPAKDKLLADRDKPEVSQYLNKEGVGCQVVQDETFFVDLKKEEFTA